MAENPYYYHHEGGDFIVVDSSNRNLMQHQQQQPSLAQAPLSSTVSNQNLYPAVAVHQYYGNQPPRKPQIPRRQGHLCCGGCCDMRRAVIIVDSINLFILTMALISILIVRKVDHMVMNALNNTTSTYMDDEEMIQTFTDSVTMLNKALFPFTIIIGIVCIRLVSSMMGIIGALQYNTCLVSVTAILYCFDVVLGLILMNPFDIIVYGLFAYPHIVFIREVNLGIMSPETYHSTEDFCCCCV